MSVTVPKVRILLIEDDMNDAHSLTEKLGSIEFSLNHVTSIAEAQKAISKQHFEVILVDMGLQDTKAFETFTTVRNIAPDSIIIALISLDDDELALKVVAAGAQDYFSKDQVNASLLKLAIRHALEKNKLLTALHENETRFRITTENSLGFMFTHDLDGTLLSINKSAAKNLGYEPEEAVGKNIAMLVQEAYRPMLLEYLSNILSHSIAEGIMYTRTKSGDKRVWEYRNLLFNQGKEKYVIGFAQDVTARVQFENRLKETNQQLVNSQQEIQQRSMEGSILSEMTDLLLACQNTDDIFNLATNAMQQLFGDRFHGGICEIDHATKIVRHKNAWGDFLPLMQDFPSDACFALQTNKLHRSNRPETHCAHTVGTKSQTAFCVPLEANHRTFGILHFEELPDTQSSHEFGPRQENLAISIAEQVSMALTNVHLREDLRSQAIHDPLTNLFNRRYIEEWLDRELLRTARYNRPLSLAFLDIDHFKNINDSYGHLAGDEVLRHIGKLLHGVLRRTDLIGRYGGEEFIVVFPETSLAHAYALADKIRVTFNALSIQTETDNLMSMTLSIGLAGFPEHGTTMAELIDAADRALYRAKKDGRNRVILEDVDLS